MSHALQAGRMTDHLEIHWDYSMFFKLWKCARLSQQVQLTEKKQIWIQSGTNYGTLHRSHCHLNFILYCTWMSTP